MKKNIYILFSLFAASIYFFFSFWQSSGTIDRSIVIPVGVSRLSEPEVATHSLPSNSSSSISDPKDIAGSTQPMEDQYMSAAFDYSLGDARLIGEAGVMGSDEILTINPIEESQLPPLNQGMVNVTGDNAGYRMLPDGMTFKDDIQIVLPYDSTLLPMGFTPNDIKTYYFDIKYGRWIEIERDSVDENNQLVISKVNHFTDFINAVLKTPEMPETSAYAPTQMNDIKAANPLEGLQLMQPPTANNNGTANMTYPLELPAGRQGMQPNLALSYSSGGGNGWLGIGWDISIPAITVETRWGVPRYDGTKESEVYLLNGEQLVTKDAEGKHRTMPHRTNQWINRLQGNIQYYPRVEETFDSIVRHGTNPTNYWWSVTDRNGITSYYGKQKCCDQLDVNSVLRDAYGNIAHWALTETVDPYGNSVRYYYDIISHSGVQGSNIMGQQIYIDSISYTCTKYEEGKYAVVFNRRASDRQDVIISGNRGFKEVTAATLCNIKVLYKDTVVRAFVFLTDNDRSSQFKTRLKTFLRIDTPEELNLQCENLDTSLYANTLDKFAAALYNFEYYDYPSANNLFSNPVTQILTSNNIQSSFLSSGFSENDATALGATKGKSWSVGGAVALGLGPNVCMTSVSLGGNFDYSSSQSEGLLTLIDLNGDGLVDKVYKNRKKLYYCKQIATGDQSFSFGAPVLLGGISDFLKESSETITWGLQASAGLSASGGWPKTTSTTTTYFADINGDGLTDLITERGALFNSLNSDGNPVFSPIHVIATTPPDDSNGQQTYIQTSATPCGGIIFDGEVNDSIICETIWDTIGEKSYDEESLLRFLADGYTCVVNDDSTKMMIYRKTIICEPEPIDPDMDAVKVWIAPYNGYVKITSNIQLVEDTSLTRQQSRYANGVIYSIQHNSKNVYKDIICTLESDSSTILATGVILEDDYVVHPNFIDSVYVYKNDIIFFRLNSRGNRSFDKVKWTKTIVYDTTDIVVDEYGKEAKYYNAQEDFVLSGKSYFQAPSSGTVYISGELKAHQLYRAATLSIYKNNTVMYSQLLPADTSNTEYSFLIETNFTVLEFDDIKFVITCNSNNTTWSNIEFAPMLKFYPNAPTADMPITDTIRYAPQIYLDIHNHVVDSIDIFYHKLFGPLYRGWGQFAYNNHSNFAPNSSIVVSSLRLPSYFTAGSLSSVDTNDFYLNPSIANDTTQTAMTSTFNAVYNPLSTATRWVEMTPNTEYQAWMGYGNITGISRDYTANTRRIYFVPTEPEEEAEPIPQYDHAVPVALDTAYPVQTIRKVNESSLDNCSFSASVLMASMGISRSHGHNKIISDYMDLNGDRYPDVIGVSNVQYTMPWGGIGPMQLLDSCVSGISESSTHSIGENFGASYSMPKRNTSGNPKKAKISFDGAGNAGVDLGGGNDTTDYIFMDVNGDGLPDRVNSSGQVALNVGYRFLGYEYWNSDVIRSGESVNAGLSLGANFNISQVSIGGGVGVNISRNKTNSMLMDVNGDGLPDKVSKSSNGIVIRYNLGSGNWSNEETVSAIDEISYGKSFSESVNAAVTAGFTFLGYLKITGSVQTAPFNRTFSKDTVQLSDVNNDGYVDYITSSSEDEMTVRYNQAGKTNLLKKVTNFTGSSILLNYEMPLSCYEQPQRSWNLTEVTTHDPRTPLNSDSTRITFEYRNPHYDRNERMAFGYDTVISYQYDIANNTVYRYNTVGYNNYNFNKRGRKTSETVCDGQGNKYVETLYEAQLMDINNGTLVGDSACPSEVFVSYEADVTYYYEGQATPQIITEISKHYNNKRNIFKYINRGNNAHHDEYFEADITYQTGMGHNLISLPVEISVKNYSGDLLQKRTAEYNNLGKVTRISQYSTSTNSSDLALTYDNYGNVNRITFPPNHNNQQLYYDYTYDNTVHTYPIKVESALGYYSTAVYDYKWGKPTRTVDINGNEMQYQYDNFGRNTHITAPNELAAGDTFTIKMEYAPVCYVYFDYVPIYRSYAVTRHYDVQHPQNYISTVLICDGWGRLLQTKKDGVVNGTEVSLVSGRVEYDCFGRTIEQYHPFSEELYFNDNSKYYNSYIDTNMLTTTKFDILDRQIQITLPTGDITTMSYDFGTHDNKTYFKTTTTDALGNDVITLTGTRQQQIQTILPGNIATAFIYNPLGQLLSSTDPDGSVTSHEYNMLGQRISRKHPDAGEDRYEYDPAGNLISHTTQNLLNNGGSIDYTYNYNQLTKIHYPENPENDVYYFYGDNTATNNRKGRIYAIEDASGRQEFSYGRMGEVIENIRTFALPGDPNTYTFTMNFEYDSWNRILSTTYPDGEHVLYEYNRGGQLSKMSSNYNNEVYHYVDSINYNKFEQRTAIYYGNGTRAEYQYDILQRLTHLKSISNNGVMQEIDYTFDAVNNIVDITNSAGVLNNGLGGTYNHNYSYDNSYRLISSNGLWDNNNNSLDYQLNLVYSRDGRILTKTQSATTLIGGMLSNFSYNNKYKYNTNQPHTVKEIVDFQNHGDQYFNWDANGNLTYQHHKLNGERKLCWDEENRLMAVGNDNYTSYYIYDNSGERTYKLTGLNTLMNINGRWVNFATMDNPTLYTSAYLVAGIQGYTKHYYAGNERVSSAIGLGGLANINDPLPIEFGGSWDEKSGSLMEEMNRTIVECLKNDYNIATSLHFLHGMTSPTAGTMDRYFYHPDHLGSSSWITDGSGNVIQHLHYLPFGEDWVDQRNASWNAPYTFSGKEKDVETGYSYFGARYYDSGLSIWLSVDPMSDKYPNLTPYAYCANNPVILVDPDGRRIIAYDRTTKKFMKAYFKEHFGSCRMFKFDSNNELKIRERSFEKALARANEHQRKLLLGMRDAIEVNDIALVQIREKTNGIMKFYVKEGYTATKFPDPANSGGGGIGYSPLYEGFLIGISHIDAQNQELSASGMRTLGKDDPIFTESKTGKSASAVFFHEVLDEFLNFFSEKKCVDINSPQIDKVEYRNAALQNLKKTPSDGLDHQK